MLLVSLLETFGVKVGEAETSKAVEAVVMVILFVSGVYGRWRINRK